MTQCRHCGAFECAVAGFEYLCKLLWSTPLKANGNENATIPETWLRQVFAAFENEDGNIFVNIALI